MLFFLQTLNFVEGHIWPAGLVFDTCGLSAGCVLRFPLYYELKVAFVIWLLSPYTRGASLIYRKCLHPLLSSRERVRRLLRHECLPLSRLDCTKNCEYSAGNRRVHCSGQREELRDHGELWETGPEHRSHGCRLRRRQGKCCSDLSPLNPAVSLWGFLDSIRTEYC